MHRERPPPRGPHQAAAIPFRVRHGAIELCLITTMSDRQWSIPKGVIDDGETPIQTALREAAEEAGIRGEIVGGPLGRYEYAKWGMDLVVEVYLLRVTEVAASWPEMVARERRWVAPADAVEALVSHPVRELVREGLARVAGTITS